MKNPTLAPEKITKPIQILAAWLAGLIIVNSAFLGSALIMDPSWERSALVVASILNVPAFISAIFILQTKFRPELQEDQFYHEYISKKNANIVSLRGYDSIERKISAISSDLSLERLESSIERYSPQEKLDWSRCRVALNRQLNEFDDILLSLTQNGVPVEVIFGKPKEEPDAPNKNIISISRFVDYRFGIKILTILKDYSFDGFELWTPMPDAGETEDIYIGSYGTDDGYVPFSGDILKLISTARDADLENIFESHQRTDDF